MEWHRVPQGLRNSWKLSSLIKPPSSSVTGINKKQKLPSLKILKANGILIYQDYVKSGKRPTTRDSKAITLS